MEKNKSVVISVMAPSDCKKNLRDMGYNVIEGCILPYVDKAVAHHIDMQLVRSGEREFICAPSSYEYYSRLFPDDVNLFCGEREPRGKYPGDVLYNVAFTGKYAIHNYDYTDNSFGEKCLSKKINVKQGYTKCNICIVSENALITSDEGIARSMGEYPIDVLTIRSGYIELPGYDYGFIGGCSGLIEKKLLAFAGDISTHPDYFSIRDFCNNHGVDICSLGIGNLVDVGTIIAVG